MATSTSVLDPWLISDDDFPAEGTPAEQWRFLLGYAILAPSGHNTQPWLFEIEGDAVRLFADRSRRLPVVDPDDRALVISCGAALGTLQVALRYFGYAGDVTLRPEPDEPDLLALVRFGAPHEPTDVDEVLFRAIPKRRTNRRPFESRPLPTELVQRLQATVTDAGVQLVATQDPTLKEALADLVAQGDRLQMENDAFREELSDWMRRGHSPSRDGMPAYAFGVSEALDFATPVAAFLIRRFDMGKGQAARDHELATGAPLLAVLVSDRDAPEAWLRTGQALAWMLLTAESEGVRASYLNQPIEEPSLREKLGDLLGLDGYPQLLLRLGFAPPLPTPTPRRPIEDVVRG